MTKVNLFSKYQKNSNGAYFTTYYITTTTTTTYSSMTAKLKIEDKDKLNNLLVKLPCSITLDVDDYYIVKKKDKNKNYVLDKNGNKIDLIIIKNYNSIDKLDLPTKTLEDYNF